MTSLGLSSYAFAMGAAAALLAGCGGSQPPIGAPGAMPQSATVPAYRNGHVLYSFGGRNGREPYASLIAVGGTLYGTTNRGGRHGWGTVFSVTTAGEEHVLYSFNRGAKGYAPTASLINVNGTLYGTTYAGGAYSGCQSAYYTCGTVFKISTSGSEQVIHSFAPVNDGSNPSAGLVDVNGTLYGTTVYGGAHNGGTVFSISTSGAEHVLYSFGASKSDGCEPTAGLVDVNGTLYGTSSNCGANVKGTVFSVTADGYEKVLHTFGYGDDGTYPGAGLVEVNGTLYGTTSGGGAYGYGTVFSITASGNEEVLHSFRSGSDGARPGAGLLDVSGKLYGTTNIGGRYNDGTAFRITLSGSEKVLHSFGRRRDGADPGAGLIDVNGTLYGTTIWQGRHGFGTVFSLTP